MAHSLNDSPLSKFLSARKEMFAKAVKEKKIKLVHPVTLFEPDIGLALREKKCPYCFCRLYISRDGKRARCKSKKHKHPFNISTSKLINK